MTAIMRMGFWISYIKGGRLEERIGDPGAQLAEVTMPGTGKLVREITIAAGATTTLWEYADLNDFETVVLLVRGSGYLNLAIKADKPTSSTDSTPLGTHESWRQIDISCKVPFLLNTDAALVHDNPLLDNGDSGGMPTILSDAGTEDGKVYKIVAKNPSTTASVVVEVYVLN